MACVYSEGMSDQPQDDRLPARFDPDALKKLTKQLTNMVRGYARDRARVRNLPTFSDRTKGDLTRRKAQVEWSDRPEIELYLTHRDAYEQGGQDLAECRARLKDVDAYNIGDAMEAMARLETARAKHLGSMELILAMLQKEFGNREGLMGKLASDGAKIAESARQHLERVDLMERLKNMDGGNDTDDEKVEKLAKRFNMRPDELRRKLAEGTFGLNGPDLSAPGDDALAS